MKHFHFLLLLTIVLLIPDAAISQADAILGSWQTESKESIIKIYKEGDIYFGKIESCNTINSTFPRINHLQEIAIA